MSTGMPAGIWLTKFGVLVEDYFGHTAYHVGSSLKSKDWRDVDVRLILPDDEFREQFGRQQSAEVNPKLAAVTLAFSALGQAMTGLPIDFQIQPQSWANEKYPHTRSALIEIRPRARLDAVTTVAEGASTPDDPTTDPGPGEPRRQTHRHPQVEHVPHSKPDGTICWGITEPCTA